MSCCTPYAVKYGSGLQGRKYDMEIGLVSNPDMCQRGHKAQPTLKSVIQKLTVFFSHVGNSRLIRQHSMNLWQYTKQEIRWALSYYGSQLLRCKKEGREQQKRGEGWQWNNGRIWSRLSQKAGMRTLLQNHLKWGWSDQCSAYSLIKSLRETLPLPQFVVLPSFSNHLLNGCFVPAKECTQSIALGSLQAEQKRGWGEQRNN